MILLDKKQRRVNTKLRMKDLYSSFNQIDWKESDFVISICCGKGQYEKYIIENFKINKMICFDINRKSLRIAKKNNKSDNVSFVYKNIRSLNLSKYKGLTKLLCFGYSHDPLKLLFILFRKKDLFDFLQNGGKFYIYPAEGGAFFRNTDYEGIRFFERTMTETMSTYMSFLSNVFETKVYNNSIIEIGKCLLSEEELSSFLKLIRSEKSVIHNRTLVNI